MEPSENSDATMSSLEIAAIQESVENIAPLLQSAEGIEKLGLGAVEAVQLKQALKCLEEVSETGDKVAELTPEQMEALRKSSDLLVCGAEERQEHLQEVMVHEALANVTESEMSDGGVTLNCDNLRADCGNIESGSRKTMITKKTKKETLLVNALKASLEAGAKDDDKWIELTPEENKLLKSMLERATKPDTANVYELPKDKKESLNRAEDVLQKAVEKQGGQLSATEAVCVVDALATLQAVMDSDDVESSVEERYAVQQAFANSWAGVAARRVYWGQKIESH